MGNSAFKAILAGTKQVSNFGLQKATSTADKLEKHDDPRGHRTGDDRLPTQRLELGKLAFAIVAGDDNGITKFNGDTFRAVKPTMPVRATGERQQRCSAFQMTNDDQTLGDDTSRVVIEHGLS